jgi:hypothetical protein
MGYLNLVGSFVYKEPLFRSKMDALAENDAQLKTDGWAQNSKTIFYQSAVPVGWTQDVSQNDKALRVVGPTGGGSSGGSQGLSVNIPLAHTHSVSADDAHTHAYAAHTHSFGGGTGGSNIGNPTSEFAGGGFFNRYTIGGPTTINQLKALMTTPGVITLGSLAAHDHGGASDSQLADLTLSYCDVIIGTKNANGGTYTDLTNYWSTGTKIDFDPLSAGAANDAYNYGVLMPAGTISLFVMASAPAGWTKLSTINDRMLRVVSGAGGGSGGTQPISSGITLAHGHSLTPTVDHTHSIPDHTHQIDGSISSPNFTTVTSAQTHAQADGSGNLVQTSDSGPTGSRTVYQTTSTNSGSGSTSAAGGHTHDVPSALATITLAYVDVIQCSKDAGGAPYAYTDYTAQFVWKNLVSKQRLNTLAKNDAYIQYHTTPTLTAMLFFMASPPTGWTKITAQDDKALRVVSGGTGGIAGGGSQLMSQTLTLGHTHTIVAAGGHGHTAFHIHPLATSTATINGPTSTVIEARGGNHIVSSGHTGGANLSSDTLKTTSSNPPEVPVADPDHSHGGATGSALSDISLAYADVIWCSKT